MSKSKGNGTDGGHRGTYSFKSKSKSSAKTNYDRRFVKAHYLKVKTKKEETGKQILARIMRELWASIERKERRKNLKKSLTYHHH